MAAKPHLKGLEMAEKLGQKWNISSPWNAVFLALLLLFAIGAIGVSLLDLFGFPLLFPDGETGRIEGLPAHGELALEMANGTFPDSPLHLENSPHHLNLTILTPEIAEGHSLEIVVVSNGRIIDREDCPEDEDLQVGATSVECNAPLKYDYSGSSEMRIYAILYDAEADQEYAASSPPISAEWGNYEGNFWSSSLLVALFAFVGFLFVAVVGAGMLFFSTRIRHDVEYEGEYSVNNLINPFKGVRTLSQAFRAFISSPLFWALEIAGILLIIAYLAMSTTPWKSSTALFAFFISGAIALITPFLLAALMWFADYREREPLRIIASMFLWGGLACLMSIGMNSIGGEFFAVCGLSFIAASFTAPIIEEFFKGMGLVVFSFHHEYDDMVDGIVFGFVIGMGFSFVEDWLYLLKNPMGADVWGWLIVFILRSLFFAANHGVFTAMTGAAIGLLKQWRFPYAPIGMLGGMLPAMLLHAIHNSGEIWMELFGTPGICAYCCILLPIFDYGGLAVIAILMIGGVALAQKRKE